MHELELLSPAANHNFGKAAISFGADAVYIGPTRFGARHAVANPISEIESLIKFAHPYHAKVYATVNTLLFDHEIEDAVKLIWQLYYSGIDGVIIQDLGLLECDLPPVKLIASTQMHNFSSEKISFLEKAGFSRVILARELSLDEIQTIRKNCSVELESFVHGSLCVSLSGQCYMSQSLCKKSGNRGECCQACRSDYSLISENGLVLANSKHLLSLKDLNLSAHITQLIKSGISSFKIEGRLKDEYYVKNITAYYRKVIDAIIEKDDSELCRSSSGKTSFSFNPNPSKSFNRGFTEYFINGRKEKLSSWLSQKSLGEFIGVAEKSNDSEFRIVGSEKLRCGDGIVWFDENDLMRGGFINCLSSNTIKLSSNHIPQSGKRIFRNFDKSFTDILDRNPVSRKINLNISIEYIDSCFIVKAIDEDCIVTKLLFHYNADKSIKVELARDSAKNQMSKTGESIFNTIGVVYDGQFHLPVAVLNQWRRELLTQHSENRALQHSKKSFPAPHSSNHLFPLTKEFKELNITNSKAKLFYKNHGINTDEMGYDLGIQLGVSRIMQCRYCLRFELNKCPVHQDNNAGNAPWMIENNKTIYTLKFNCKKCFMEVWTS